MGSSKHRERDCFFETLLSEEMPKRQKIRQKVSNDDFTILNYSEYPNLLNYEYNLSQLKLINKTYKQKISGNKNQLLCRIYNYLKYSYDANIIQKYWFGYIQRRLNRLRGPAFFKRDKCINDTDFFTLEACSEIPVDQFFSFTDSEGFTYGFNLLSIYTLFTKNNGNTNNGNTNVENPYNKKKMSPNVLTSIRNILKLSRIMGINVNTNINNELDEDVSNDFSMRVLSLFQLMDSLGNYTQTHWFTSLSKQKLNRFIRELYDIWSYRAQLSQNIKRDICPPYGNPFRSFNINNSPMMSFSILQRSVLYVMEQMVTSGITTENKTLGAFYVLSALTLVNEDAAEAMPWLYESVISH